MPFLGSTPAEQYKSLAKQTITGDGSTAYTLNQSVTNAYDMEVFINNVRQEPDTSYTASGTTITFTAAVNSSDSCYIIFQGKSVGSINPPANSVGGSQIQNTSVTADHMHTAAGVIERSNTAPSNPLNGDFWYDLNDYAFKFYDGSDWQLIKGSFVATGGTVSTSGGYKYHVFNTSGTFTVTRGTTTAQLLIVAGGGGGGFQVGGGGGAGGLVSVQNFTVSQGTYTVTVGAGGAGSPDSTTQGSNGGNSLITGQTTAIGGGRGGNHNVGTDTPGSGGSGGGGGGNSQSVAVAGGSGTSGQGYNGGRGVVGWSGGGGGGAGGAGQNGQSGSTGGVGGVGLEITNFSDFGTSNPNVYGTGGATQNGGGWFAGGGGGCMSNTGGASHQTLGGAGGGGRGFGNDGQSRNSTTHGDDGAPNTGGGGGGVRDLYASGSSYTRAGNGGSGVVIIRYQA